MTLTKADLAEAVYKEHETITKREAIKAVESFLRLSKNVLIAGDNLLISGFGKFNVKNKRPRKGRNPHTGEDLTLDARQVVTFRPSGLLRARVNES